MPEPPEEPPMEGTLEPPAPTAAAGDAGQAQPIQKADGLPVGQDAHLPKLQYLPLDVIRAGLDLQEVGDADLFSRMFSGQVVYDHSEKEWYLWRSNYWEMDRTGYVYQLLARRVAPQYLHAAAEMTSGGRDEIAKELTKRAAALRNKKRLDNVLSLAGRDPALALTGEEWDADPWLLGCLNGVIDLHTGNFRPGKPEDYIRAHIDADWQGIDHPAPRWEQFLLEVFAGKQDLVFFMQRLLGYGMTGLSTEHVFPILWGEGRNGKGTLLQVLYETLGERIATPVPAEELMANPRGSQGAQPFLYGLRGKRIVWASESQRGHRIDESLVKRLTGGDTITVRTLYTKPVSFDPSHLILMLTNYRPHINADGQAIWDRVLLVPFTERFVISPQASNEHKQDPFLGAALAKERAGILAWLVRGCLEWQEVRLSPPECVLLATQEYRESEDITGMFLGERCEIDRAAGVKASKLYAAYATWCKESGFSAMSLSTFGAEMVKKFERKRTQYGWFYHGVGLQEDAPA
jgi:putative DNA primase/helicase